jgi:hypothetical protein
MFGGFFQMIGTLVGNPEGARRLVVEEDRHSEQDMFSRGMRRLTLTVSTGAEAVITRKGMIVLTGFKQKFEAMLGHQAGGQQVRSHGAQRPDAHAVTIAAISPDLTRQKRLLQSSVTGPDSPERRWGAKPEKPCLSGLSQVIATFSREYSLQKAAYAGGLAR